MANLIPLWRVPIFVSNKIDSPAVKSRLRTIFLGGVLRDRPKKEGPFCSKTGDKNPCSCSECQFESETPWLDKSFTGGLCCRTRCQFGSFYFLPLSFGKKWGVWLCEIGKRIRFGFPWYSNATTNEMNGHWSFFFLNVPIVRPSIDSRTLVDGQLIHYSKMSYKYR